MSLFRFDGLRPTIAVVPYNCRRFSMASKKAVKCHITSRRAVLVPRFGGPEVFEYREDVPVPDLKPDEVLVRARAASVNPIDLRIRSGYGRNIFKKHLPFILGRDVSGEVAAIGSSVKSFSVGQEVFGAAPPKPLKGGMGGTYTDYAILTEDEVYAKPSSISHVEASAIAFASMTAWCAIRGAAGITQGQKVFVFGGGGAVGFAAIQLAVAQGCHVTTTCGTGSIDKVMKAGAEQVVNYNTQDVESTVKEKFDAVFDTVGGADTERIGVNLVKKGGHYLTVVGEMLSKTDKYGLLLGLPAGAGLLFKKKLQYRMSYGIGYSWIIMDTNKEGMQEVGRLTEAGKLRMPVDKTFPFQQAREAHEAKEKGQIRGKIVLEMD